MDDNDHDASSMLSQEISAMLNDPSFSEDFPEDFPEDDNFDDGYLPNAAKTDENDEDLFQAFVREADPDNYLHDDLQSPLKSPTLSLPTSPSSEYHPPETDDHFPTSPVPQSSTSTTLIVSPLKVIGIWILLCSGSTLGLSFLLDYCTHRYNLSPAQFLILTSIHLIFLTLVLEAIRRLGGFVARSLSAKEGFIMAFLAFLSYSLFIRANLTFQPVVFEFSNFISLSYILVASQLLLGRRHSRTCYMALFLLILGPCLAAACRLVFLWDLISLDWWAVPEAGLTIFAIGQSQLWIQEAQHSDHPFATSLGHNNYRSKYSNDISLSPPSNNQRTGGSGSSPAALSPEQGHTPTQLLHAILLPMTIIALMSTAICHVSGLSTATALFTNVDSTLILLLLLSCLLSLLFFVTSFALIKSTSAMTYQVLDRTITIGLTFIPSLPSLVLNAMEYMGTILMLLGICLFILDRKLEVEGGRWYRHSRYELISTNENGTNSYQEDNSAFADDVIDLREDEDDADDSIGSFTSII